MRTLLVGHKLPLLTPGGLLLLLSLLLSLLPHLAVAVLIGYHSVFLVQVPLLLTASCLLLVKIICDKDFRSGWPLSQKLIYCLLGAIFPLTSPRPGTKQEERHTDKGEAARDTLERSVKSSGAELVFLYLLHCVCLLGGMVVFSVLQQEEEYSATLAKVEEASGLSLDVVLYCICPLCLVLSGGARVLSLYWGPWALVRDSWPWPGILARAWPPLPSSLYSTSGVRVHNMQA